MSSYIEIINQAVADAQAKAHAAAAPPPAAVKAIGRVKGITEEDRAAYVGYAAKGALIASQNPQVAAARALNSDGRYRWGFDIATGLCQGMSLPGPGQTDWRNKLGRYNAGPNNTPGSNEAMQGFDVAQALQHGISKAQLANQAAALAAVPPDQAAGILITEGMSGSGSPADQKAAIMQTVTNNPNVTAGAQMVIDKKVGFFKRILAFFGL